MIDSIQNDLGRPAIVHVPTYERSRGDNVRLALDALGLTVMPWQELALRQAMAVDAGDKWMAEHVALVIPWERGKNDLVRLRELVGAAVLAERIVHICHTHLSAEQRLRELIQTVESTPPFEHLITKVRYAHGDQGIDFQGGGSIRITGRGRTGPRGRSADLLIVDDASRVTFSDAYRDMLPVLVAAKDGPHVWWVDTQRDHPTGPPGPYAKLMAQALTPEAKPVLYLEWVSTGTQQTKQ